MWTSFRAKMLIGVFALLCAGFFAVTVSAGHSWGNFHWARTANPLALILGDNVSSAWDGHLGAASVDWSASTVIDTAVVAGQTDPRKCRPRSGRVEVCNSKYGNNGWLGIASIWINGDHITQGTVKLNDTYFTTARYNTPAWKNFVMCQEVGHIFGLDHQDEIFTNPNLGTCMDYTNDPAGTQGTNGALNNEHPNVHDYDQLGTMYTHLDTFTTALRRVFSAQAAVADNDIDTSDAREWGAVVKKSRDGKNVLHERDLGRGKKLFTFVIWAD